MPKTPEPAPYPSLRALIGRPADDPAVVAFLAAYRVAAPAVAAWDRRAAVKRRGFDLLFSSEQARYAVEIDSRVGTLVGADFFQEGIDRHKPFRGELPRGLHVDMKQPAIEAVLGAPTEACDCGQSPPCFVMWHVRDFDAHLSLHATLHAIHTGRTRPKPGRLDLTIHLPHVPRAHA